MQCFERWTSARSGWRSRGTRDCQCASPYAYRFYSVPNGIYQIDMKFAELGNTKLGKRLFDVIAENTLVLPAHDIVYEVKSESPTWRAGAGSGASLAPTITTGNVGTFS